MDRTLVYCDTGAYRKDLRELENSGCISVHQFKYENQTRQIKKGAIPSNARYSDLQHYTYGELGTTDVLNTLSYDQLGGDGSKFAEIQDIVGANNRRDVQHLDSAQMTGCKIFLTSDKGDIWSKKDQLFGVTGLRIFLMPSEWDAFIAFLDNDV